MGSWGDVNGQHYRRACDHIPSPTLNAVNGRTAGNILNTSTGRSLCCASRALPTRPILGRTLRGKPEFRIAQNLFRTPILERLRLPLRCLFAKSGANVDCWSSVKDGTKWHAPTQAGYALEPQNAHSPECAGRSERQLGSTRNWWT